MQVCKEMQKLRDWLDENKIPWEDVSEDFCRFNLNKIEHEMWICRTHFNIKGHKVSVINGYGTYGGVRNNLRRKPRAFRDNGIMVWQR